MLKQSGSSAASDVYKGQDLAPYRVAVERITRRRKHIRSTEIEELLARASEMADASEVTQGVLEDGELPLGEIRDDAGLPVRLAQGNLQRYLDSADRRVRQEAWESSADGYLAFRNTFGATLTGAIKRDVFYARARGYDSSLAAALDYDNIDPAVFHNLLDTVWRNFPVWHRYFRVRRLLLDLPAGDHHVYDLEAPLADTISFPWQRGVDTILASLAPLGDAYVNEVRRGMAERVLASRKALHALLRTPWCLRYDEPVPSWPPTGVRELALSSASP